MRGINSEVYFTMPSGRQTQNLIDGILYASPPPDEEHEQLLAAIHAALRTFARERGGRAVSDPFPCWLNADTVVVPDIAYVSPERGQLVARYLQGAPDLAVEVLSPGTIAFDREAKFTAYGKNGVREAWFVDPAAQTVNVVSGDGERWVSETTVSFGDEILSTVVSVGAANLGIE